MNVTVASHPNVPFSFTLTRGLENWGRGWDPQARVNRPEDVNTGAFFQKQWDWAIENDPALVFVGGWNEWIAYKQLWEGEYMLCDAVDREFSRDIEPMCGGYEDAFYIQLIRNIRRYKGLEGSEKPAGPLRLEATALPPIPRDHRGSARRSGTRRPHPSTPCAASRPRASVLPAADPGVRAGCPGRRHGTRRPAGDGIGSPRRLAGLCLPPALPAGGIRRLPGDAGKRRDGHCDRQVSPGNAGGRNPPVPAPGGPGCRRGAGDLPEGGLRGGKPQDILSYYTSGSTLPPAA